MESYEEQIRYGNYCKPHGNPVGTPQGYDIMCGLCEAGMDEKVYDTQYALWFRFNDGDINNDMSVPWRRIADWFASDPLQFSTINPYKRSAESWWSLFDDPSIKREVLENVQHKVTVVSEYYWVVPDDS